MAADRRISDSNFDQQYDKAVRRGQRNQPRAASAAYDAVRGLIEVQMTNGARFAFPPAVVQGLDGAAPEALDKVEVYGAGMVLRWEKLDVDHELDALLGGVFGTRAWMREQGRRGGRATSEAKARAARANGAKGGRPRKRGRGSPDGR